MRQHALDGEVGLAGIGGAQHCRDTGAAGSRRSGRLRRKSNSHYASRTGSRTFERGPPPASCITMRRRTSAWLSFRTSLERIAPESLTPALYAFVHGDIWQAGPAQLQDGVAGRPFKCVLTTLNVNTGRG